MKTMQTTFLFLMIAILHLLLPHQAYTVELTSPGSLKILVEKNSAGSLLEVKGAYFIDNPSDGSPIGSGLLGKRYLIRPFNNGIKWGEQFPGFHQIRITPKTDNASILLNGIQYSGSIIVYKVGDALNIVNEVSVEDYLKSMLTSQFPHSLEHEVMSAVAIAARTTAYYHKTKNQDVFWDLDAQEIQYQGTALVVPNSAIVAAIEATRDLIMVYSQEKQKQPFIATWTEHSAGKTAAYASIFRKNVPSPKGVNAAHAALDREDSKWSFSISKQKLADLVKLPKVSAIDLFIDQLSGKTYAVRFKAEQNSTDLEFSKLQALLGKNLLLSTDFKVELKNNNIVFSGYGKGFGVGICLHSATAMAQNGELAKKILSTFFPDTSLLNLSNMGKK